MAYSKFIKREPIGIVPHRIHTLSPEPMVLKIWWQKIQITDSNQGKSTTGFILSQLIPELRDNIYMIPL